MHSYIFVVAVALAAAVVAVVVSVADVIFVAHPTPSTMNRRRHSCSWCACRSGLGCLCTLPSCGLSSRVSICGTRPSLRPCSESWGHREWSAPWCFLQACMRTARCFSVASDRIMARFCSCCSHGPPSFCWANRCPIYHTRRRLSCLKEKPNRTRRESKLPQCLRRQRSRTVCGWPRSSRSFFAGFPGMPRGHGCMFGLRMPAESCATRP